MEMVDGSRQEMIFIECTKCKVQFVETQDTSWWGFPFCSACNEALNKEYEEYERINGDTDE